MDPTPQAEPVPETDLEAQHRAHERKEMLAAGMLALPNLFLRSFLTLTLLYGLLGAVLIAIVQLGYLSATVAVAIGCGIVLLQFLLGPWIMDLSLRSEAGFQLKERWGDWKREPFTSNPRSNCISVYGQ